MRPHENVRFQATSSVEGATAADAVLTDAAPLAAPDEAETPRVSDRDRSQMLWLTNGSHAVNHFQNGMISVLYPAIMAELGFGYAQLGVLSASQSFLSNQTQALYGFLAPFAKRTRLLGVGNLIMGLGTLLTALVGSLNGLIA